MTSTTTPTGCRTQWRRRKARSSGGREGDMRDRFVGFFAAFVVMFSASSFSRAQPSRVRYDDHCLIIDGKDTFIFSGAFHYFRCPKELWRDRFTKMKLAGLNTVETYVPWNWHEPHAPADVEDFSKVDLTELDQWLTMAEDEFGFNVILRPGPYICAEWDSGGFPRWLMKYRPEQFDRATYWLRSDEPVFLSWERHWYRAVANVAAKHQTTHRPAGKNGIILWQIENEYDQAQQPTDVSFNHIKALAQWSREFGIDVPL